MNAAPAGPVTTVLPALVICMEDGMPESRLRTLVRAIAELGVSRRYMELLLKQDTMTRADIKYVERLAKTLRLEEESHASDRRNDASTSMPRQDGLSEEQSQ